MSSRNDRLRVQARTQSPDRARTRRANAVSRSTPPSVRSVASGPIARRVAFSTLPLDIHRAIAAMSLVLMLIISLGAPLSTASSNSAAAAALITPQINGSGSVSPGFSGAEIENALFPYMGVIERSRGNAASVWPDVPDVLSFDPNNIFARRAIVGQVYAESTGNLDKRVRETGLEISPDAEKLGVIESTYQEMETKGDLPGRGVNGLASVLLIQSLGATGEQRKQMESGALFGFRQAINEQSKVWQYTYNWGLASFLSGNYATAYEAMRNVRYAADAANNKLIPFWMGLSALRAGDPALAIPVLKDAIAAVAPTGSNDAMQQLYSQARELSREALGDAQWAYRRPSEAYTTYYNSLLLANGSAGLYDKWLRLGLEQRGYDQLVADMQNLETSSSMSSDPRLHHDRARLLSLLGREAEADREYRKAIDLGQEDSGLLVSYGQSLESRGDHEGAIVQATQAITKMGNDPTKPDMAMSARAATTNTTSLADQYTAQQLLNANILRARAWGGQNKKDLVSNLVLNMTTQAGQLPPDQAGLLNVYGGWAFEAAGMQNEARDSFNTAWSKLKGLATGTPGRAAALAGLSRATAASGQDGLKVLKDNGYDLAALKRSISGDLDAGDIIYQGALLLKQQGKVKEAAGVLRTVAVLRNVQNTFSTSGVGRPIWTGNGTSAPAGALLEAADLGRIAGADRGTAALGYKEAISLNPALSPAWNNLGVLYAQSGEVDRARFYLDAAGDVSPGYGLSEQNLAAFAYKQGIGNFFTAEAAQGKAIKSLGPQSLLWGYNVRPDERGALPASIAPGSDLLSRLPSIIILALLLAHTLVGNDRATNRMGIIPTRGVIGKLSQLLDARTRTMAPALTTARSGSRALLMSIAVPSVIGMLGLAWGAGHGALEVALVYLPVSLLAAAVAFGGHGFAQYRAARRNNGVTLHHNWPVGLLLGVISIPFGFIYGWQVITRVQPAGAIAGMGGEGSSRSASGRRARTGEELELAQEAQAEAAADSGAIEAVSEMGHPVAPGRRLLSLSPAARILSTGLLANLALGLLFGAIYWLTGWPSMRLALFASMLVLAFTAVSEPPAEGWTLYRRNAPLWLGLFVFAALIVTLLSVNLV